MMGKWEEKYLWDDGVNIPFLWYFCLLSHLPLPSPCDSPGDLRGVQRLTGAGHRSRLSKVSCLLSLFPWILHSPSLCPQLFPLGTQWENLS